MTGRRLLLALVLATALATAAAGAVGGQLATGQRSAGPVSVGAPLTIGQPSAGVVTPSPTAGEPASADGTRIVGAADGLTLGSGPGQPVRGRTDLAPGTDLTVRLRSTDESRPYLRSVTATVGADGAFRATFDLSGVPPETPLRAVVHRDGTTLARTTARVVECSACRSTTPTTPSAVVVHDGDGLMVTSDPGQVIRGRTNLPPGAEVTVRLVSGGGASAFSMQAASVVDVDGTFRAVFDLEGVAPGSAFRIAVRYNGSELTTARGRVACPEGCERSPMPDEGAAFDDADVGVVQVANGSTARIRVRLGEADAATLTVTTSATDYALNATVGDGDGDGVVVLLFDTAAAAEGAGTLTTTDGGDAVRVVTERGTFVATEYRLALHPPHDGSATVATGLLVVTQGDGSGTPLLRTGPDWSAFPWASVAGLVGGAVLAALGLGLLLGIVDLRSLLGRR